MTTTELDRLRDTALNAVSKRRMEIVGLVEGTLKDDLISHKYYAVDIIAEEILQDMEIWRDNEDYDILHEYIWKYVMNMKMYIDVSIRTDQPILP